MWRHILVFSQTVTKLLVSVENPHNKKNNSVIYPDSTFSTYACGTKQIHETNNVNQT